jgi:hypothetical protein
MCSELQMSAPVNFASTACDAAATFSSTGRVSPTLNCFQVPRVKSTAELVEDFARMEGPSADRSQQDRLQSRVPHGPLALAVMVVIACVSVAWGLTTLDCPTGKDQWGACKPRDPSVRTESLDFPPASASSVGRHLIQSGGCMLSYSRAANSAPFSGLRFRT